MTTAAENQIAALFGPYVGVNFVNSGQADYSLNIVNAGTSNTNLGQQTGILFFQGVPAVYPNNISINFVNEGLNTIINIIGTVSAHELIRRITGIGDLPYNKSNPADIMSIGRDNPNANNLLANNELEVTQNEGQQLLNKCLMKHPD